jgi:hypothetical protein
MSAPDVVPYFVGTSTMTQDHGSRPRTTHDAESKSGVSKGSYQYGFNPFGSVTR